jgi:DNA polymerase-4
VDALFPHVLSQALRVGRRLRRAGLRARGVQLKLKRADFRVLTRQCTLEAPSDDGHTLYLAARSLLERAASGLGPVRLTGVSAHGLAGEVAQEELFPDPPDPRARLNAALDRITAKFGPSAVVPADLVSEGDVDATFEGFKRKIPPRPPD